MISLWLSIMEVVSLVLSIMYELLLMIMIILCLGCVSFVLRLFVIL